MKFTEGDTSKKRVASLTIEAESDVEAALLYEHLLKLREQPLRLAPCYQEVLEAMGTREMHSDELASELEQPVTAVCNRLTKLWKMGLLDRHAVHHSAGGKAYSYRRKFVLYFPETFPMRGDNPTQHEK